MFGRAILDDEDFFVTLGMLGGVKATLKTRGLNRSMSREEAQHIKAALDIYQSGGGRFAPGNEGVAYIVRSYVEVLFNNSDGYKRVYHRMRPADFAEAALRIDRGG
jgi:hypothetical protein